jgi:NADH dehydrogenase/NADH:ubiquinone oxidoreductase subunit G
MTEPDEMVNITIDDERHQVPASCSVLTACLYAGIYIPSLCFHPDLPAYGHCGLCLVEVDGTGTAYACMHSVREGMVATTTNPELRNHVAQALDRFLDLSVLPQSQEVEVLCSNFVQRAPPRSLEPDHTTAITFDAEQCVNCGRCQRMCVDVQQIGALTEDNLHLSSSECISCGQCIVVCPTFALRETSSVPRVLSALAAGKVLILQTAPAVRVSIGEAFHEPIGSIVTGKMIGAARAMGFKYVLDTNFGADLTVVEEATELIERLTHGGTLPMFTSCCSAWVNFVEKLHPEMIPHLSSCKSPMMMLAAVIRPYFARKQGIRPEDCFVVGLMPCVGKKDEIERL